MQMFALITTQGIAMAETALCHDHIGNDSHRATAVAEAIHAYGGPDKTDWDGNAEFTDCTGNDALECIACGAHS